MKDDVVRVEELQFQVEEVGKMVHVFIFIVGAVLGSFLNVVASRRITGESVIYPPSHCPRCDTALSPGELVPLLSFIVQKGQCKHCNKRISLRYFLSELVMGLVFVLWYHQYGASRVMVFYCGVSSILMVMSLVDMTSMDVYFKDVGVLVATGLIFLFFYEGDQVLSHLVILFGTLGSLLVIYKVSKGGFGVGDGVLILVLSLQLRTDAYFSFILFSLWSAAIVGAVLYLRFGDRHMKIPFVPFISFGYCLATLFPKVLGV